ncbi:thioredoxin-disulfide reductase [Carboxydocella sp. ULO1]|uniref:thioredoxin-disulfide reductase n=1 Tax=Carboxydocella sp. ULO1 TaxID=1926599 RepID=UPI0009ABBD0E|nr:thioredoxin-disulfide reductase [Carboxydocella sp. ULO1]GAW28386.1 thioredoxin-disulfide reductase [Carboxydocella sp. ULO1]
MSEFVKEISAAEFESEVLHSELPVAVDFYSTDCPPCAYLAPSYERIAEQYGSMMKFVKIYRQGNRELANQLGVKGSPTVLFFKNGEEAGKRLTGYISKPQLRLAVEEITGPRVREGGLAKVECDVLILGGGPAGLSASIYAGRAKLHTVLVDEGLPGGQAATTFHIANYPGTPGTVRGSELMQNMVNQAKSFGVEIHDLKEIFQVDLTGERKYVRTEDTEYYAKTVIIATGAEPRKLPAEGEEEFRGRGVHYCATCDGAMYQDADNVIVVGGGNSAVEEAVFLTRFAKQVTIVHQFDHFQASKIAQEEALNHPQIKVVWDSEVRKVNGEGHLTSVTVENVKTGELTDIPANGVFVYIGTQPRTHWFKGQVEMNEWGYIQANEDMEANLPGVFAAGDVRVKKFRQVITAAADGAIAGIMAEKYLMEKARG